MYVGIHLDGNVSASEVHGLDGYEGGLDTVVDMADCQGDVAGAGNGVTCCWYCRYCRYCYCQK